MKRHAISQSLGAIVVLTALIAVMLGMMNPSIVLGAKPGTEYVVVVEVGVGVQTSIKFDASVEFFVVDKTGSEINLQQISLQSITGSADIGVTFPYFLKYGKWVATVDFTVGTSSCTQQLTNTNFPAILTFNYHLG